MDVCSSQRGARQLGNEATDDTAARLLPHKLVELLGYLGGVEPGAREVFLGDVGFPLVPDAVDAAGVHGAYLARRWPGMHPDLLPFAVDSCGNRFCLVRGVGATNPERFPVAWWMYETYRAVPIASSFDRFLDWVGLSSALSAQRLVNPLTTAEHHARVVQPALEAMGVRRDFDALTASRAAPLGSLGLGMMRVDPGSAGARVLAAERALQQGRTRDAARHAEAALEAFPEFLAARWFLSGLDLPWRQEAELTELTRSLLTTPWLWQGDGFMPEFGEIPSATPQELVARVTQQLAPSECDEDPAVAAAWYDDPMAPLTWLRVAVEVAELGDPTRAIGVATNALFLSRGVQDRLDALSLLDELYDAVDATWHRAVILEDAARSVAARPRSGRDGRSPERP